MAIDHIEMALVHRQVDGLADGAAGMVDRRRHIGELHEIAEILDGGVTPPLVQRADEGRAIDRREDRVIAADDDIALGIAGMLDILPGRGLLDQGARQAAGKMHPRALYIRAGLAPHLQRFLIVAELDADLFENGIGIALDQRQPFLVQHRHQRDAPGDVRQLHQLRMAAHGAPRIGATANAAARGCLHGGIGWGIGVHDNSGIRLQAAD